MRVAHQSTASIITRCLGLIEPHHLQDILASYLPSNRHISAELHGLMSHFTTAGSKSNGRNNCSKNDSVFHLKSP
jgi:hypothetical protein